MTRFACFALAAALVTAGLSWWWQPPPGVGSAHAAGAASPVAVAADAPSLRTPSSQPEAVEAAAAAVRVDPAPPVAVPPSPALDREAPGALPTVTAAEPTPASAGAAALPPLAEIESEEVEPPGAFVSEPVAEAWVQSTVPEEPAPAAARPDAPPVDVQRSGELVRRMLGLYEAMGE